MMQGVKRGIFVPAFGLFLQSTKLSNKDLIFFFFAGGTSGFTASTSGVDPPVSDWPLEDPQHSPALAISHDLPSAIANQRKPGSFVVFLLVRSQFPK